jgi:hypothetical protein
VDRPTPDFEVENFDYANTAPRLVMVRLAGRWRTDDPSRGVVLVAWVGGQRVPLFPLPAPRSDGSVRAVFSTTPELFDDPATTFELELPDGGEIRLPAPVKHGSRRPARERVPTSRPRTDNQLRVAGRRGPEREAAERAAAEERARARRDAVRQRREAAGRTATEERGPGQRAEVTLAEELRSTVRKPDRRLERTGRPERSRSSFEQELEAMRRQHAELLAEARREHALELQAARAEIEATQRELAVAVTELRAANNQLETLRDSVDPDAAASAGEDAKAREEALERELATARAAAETARDAAEELAERLVERHGLVERARAEAEQAKAETTDVRAAVERLRDAIAVRARSANTASARRRLARSPEELERYREELRRHAEEIPPLKQEAEALRDAIYAELPYFLRTDAQQEVLPVPPRDEPAPEIPAPAWSRGQAALPADLSAIIEELTGRKVLAFMSAHNTAFEIFVLGRPASQPPELPGHHSS